MKLFKSLSTILAVVAFGAMVFVSCSKDENEGNFAVYEIGEYTGYYGELVSLYGKNFNTTYYLNRVIFNNDTEAKVVDVTPNALTFEVPVMKTFQEDVIFSVQTPTNKRTFTFKFNKAACDSVLNNL